MRSTKEIRNDIRRLKRAYHKITCGELRDIFRRYGDKQIYLIDVNGNEVPGSFYRIQGIFPTQGLNTGLLLDRWILYYCATWATF